MCRSIRPLANLEPAVTAEEIQAAAVQYVRRISGTRTPSRANAAAVDRAVAEVAAASARLLGTLVTSAPPKNREVEAARARRRAADRATGRATGQATARTPGMSPAAAG